MGRPSMRAAVDTSETGSSAGTFFDLTTVGPTITIPLAGDYDIGMSAFMGSSVANYIFAAPKYGAAATAGADGIQVWADSGNEVHYQNRFVRKNIAAASTAVKMQYATNV